MKRINKTAEIRKTIRDDLEKIAAASTKSILFVCPDCRRVTVDPADVAALEADNKRLRKELDDLKFLLDNNIRLDVKADKLIIEQATEITQLKARLVQTWRAVIDELQLKYDGRVIKINDDGTIDIRSQVQP